MSSNQISGNVVGTGGAALQNAKVSLSSTVTSLIPSRFTYTDASGNFNFQGLPAGNYQLLATSDGIVFRKPQGVTIVSNDIANVNFQASALNSANS
jgi:hypothetical protein